MPAGDIYEVTYVHTAFGQTALNRRYWKMGTVTGTEPTHTQVATALETPYGALIKPAMPGAATYKGAMISRIWPTARTMPNVITANAGVGVGATDCLPLQVTGLITLRTLFAGRRFRGRVYVPFPADQFAQSDGSPTPGYLSLLDALGTYFVSTITAGSGGNTAPMVPVLAKVTYLTHVITNVTTFDLFDRISRDKWGTQRRRGSYGSPNVSPI